MKLMKIFVHVQSSLLSLQLLLGSCSLLASAQLRGGGGFTNGVQQLPALQQQPVAWAGNGQLLQMPSSGAEQPPLMQQPQAMWLGNPAQLLQEPSASSNGPTAGNVGVPAPAASQSTEAAAAASATQHCQCDSVNEEDSTCSVSKVTVHEDHAANAGLSLAAISAIWGSSTLNQDQRAQVTLGKVSETSFMCLDDRVSRAAFFTPGGDLGEFILALASYLQERDPSGRLKPSQEVVDALLLKYVETIASTRPVVHCTDDRAIQHLEAELPLENLDLSAPPDHAEASLLQKLTEVENHGDSHMRLLLKKPEWFQLNEYLVPMAVKSFYHLLWQQNKNPKSPLYQSPKLRLEVLVGQSDPKAFLEVSSGELCHSGGVAPMLTPRAPQRAVLISHLDAVSLRRQELAAFFARIANSSPRKINPDQLHQRMDRHGWLALETTGSRIAAGLPFYTLTYS
jgi:hypothetical protein